MIMLSDNVRLFSDPQEEEKDRTIDMFTLGGTGVFCGIGAYAYEAAGTVFTGTKL